MGGMNHKPMHAIRAWWREWWRSQLFSTAAACIAGGTGVAAYFIANSVLLAVGADRRAAGSVGFAAGMVSGLLATAGCLAHPVFSHWWIQGLKNHPRLRGLWLSASLWSLVLTFAYGFGFAGTVAAVGCGASPIVVGATAAGLSVGGAAVGLRLKRRVAVRLSEDQKNNQPWNAPGRQEDR